MGKSLRVQIQLAVTPGPRPTTSPTNPGPAHPPIVALLIVQYEEISHLTMVTVTGMHNIFIKSPEN